MATRLEVHATADAIAAAAANEFLRLAMDAIRARGIARIALAGGTTPRTAYERIAAEWRVNPGGEMAWDRAHLFWGDERMVPADDARSNYGMARDALVERVPIPPANVHPIPGDAAGPAAAAAQYEGTLRDAFGISATELPRFDIVFLGMGADGHTASLFPGADTLDEVGRLAVAAHDPHTGESRVTLTLPVLNNAAAILVLVAGAEKAETLRRVLRGEGDAHGVTPGGESGREVLLPAARLKPCAGTLLWLATNDAAPWAPAGGTGPNA